MTNRITDYCHQLFSFGAILLFGLMAGFFFAFSVDVAPAMTHLDAATYITTQQWINSVVRNALFGGVYFGAVLLPFGAALFAALGKKPRLALFWCVLALAYFGLVFWVTRSINIPINNALASWNPAAPPPDWMQLRDTWNQSNLQRAWAAFACFAIALLALNIRAWQNGAREK